MNRRRLAVSNTHPAARASAPVVVTFDSAASISDIVGDFGRFVAEDDTQEEVLQRLADVLRGCGGVRSLPSVELSAGRYADIRIVEEEGQLHVVLLDVTDIMLSLRDSQQVENEAVLLAQKHKKEVGRQRPARPHREWVTEKASQPYRRESELLGSVVNEMRKPIAVLAGETHRLRERCKHDPVALRAIATIHSAVMQLDAASANALIGLGALTKPGLPRGEVDLLQVAATLQRSFAMQASDRGMSFDIRTPKRNAVVRIDGQSLQQVLINLVLHAMEVVDDGALIVTFSTSSKYLDIDIANEPEGFSAEHFGVLVTTTRLLQSNANGSLVLAVSQRMIQDMGGVVEMSPLQEGGYELWIRLPITQPDSDSHEAN